MIGCKLAAMVPERVLSLALLNVTGGGFQCCPKVFRSHVCVCVYFLLITNANIEFYFVSLS